MPSVESLVAYLLELPQQGMDDTVFEIKPHSAKIEKKHTPYRWRSCFASEEEYAQYLSDVITTGMTVRCCKAYECVSSKHFFYTYNMPIVSSHRSCRWF